MSEETKQYVPPLSGEPKPPLTLCQCGGHAKCEHEWGGWREIDGGRGGERFCQKCGLGAMVHTLSLDW